MTKKKTITVSYPHGTPVAGRGSVNSHLYRVETLTNSTEYDPSQYLEKTQVDTLCASDEWEVTVVTSPTFSEGSVQ
jgi:hypothetical protein